MKTFQKYLMENLAAGVTEYNLVSRFNSDGELTFYIHPDSVSGETMDFIVKGNSLKEIVK